MDRKPFSFQATISLVVFDQKKFYVVKDASGNLSKGKVADYTADAKGKIAIVKRGELTFADKQNYAQAAGAAGLIIVNNDGTATPVTSIALTTTFPTFGSLKCNRSKAG